ncbi:MAG: O-antigen ligase family protein [Bacteroidota bacterium]
MNINRLHSLVFFQILLILSSIFLLPTLSSIFTGTTLLTIFLFILFDKQKVILKRIRANYIHLLLLSVLYFFSFFGLLWTEEPNIVNGLKKIETQASLVIFPFIFSGLSFNTNSIKKLIRWLFLILSLLFLGAIAYFIFRYGVDLGSTIEWLSNKIHRTYFSLYIIFLSTTLFIHFMMDKTLKKKRKYLGILVLTSGVLMTQMVESRMALMCILIILTIIVVKTSNLQIKVALFICGIGFVIFTVFYLMPNTNRGTTFIEKYKKVLVKDEHYRPYHFEIRLGVWESALLVIKDNYFLGVGTGDVDNALKEACAKNLLPKYLHYTNVHNQYLDTVLRYGFLGFIIWLGTIIYFFRLAILTKDYYYLIFLFTVHIFFLTENIIGRQMGTMFYSIFNSMFYFASRQKKEGTNTP